MPKLRFPGFEGEWEERTLEKCCRCFDNKRKPISAELREKGEVPYYGANGIQDYVKDFIFNGKFLLLAEDGGHFDEYSKKPIAQYITGKSWVNNHAHVLSGKDNCLTEYIYFSLVHKDIRKYINGTSRAKLNQEDMWDIKIHVPQVKLQEKISTFLFLIEERIAAQRKLVELLKKHKRGLSSALFSGKVRIATNAKWRTYRLGDIVRRVTRKNGKATDIPLTISAQHGLIDQREFFSKAVASADMSGYYLLKQGEFAYNRSSSGEYPFGSIKKLERYHQGAVSTLYICFETLGDKDDAEFLKWYFDSFAWHREIGMICAEGARNHGLLNVPTDGFFDTKHILPSDKDERKKIASLMALADARCECAETELARLMAMKSGLLQQMFV